MIEAFERSILRDAKSAVFREYCRRVHGVDRFQYNTLTSAHFELLVDRLDLEPGGSFVDLGCAVGTMTVAVARRTHARGTGIDFAPAVIDLARRDAPSDVDVSFVEGDLNELHLPPASVDAVMAIDALYFASDLDQTIEVLLNALRPGGRLVAFHSAFQGFGGRTADRCPDGTTLAVALRNCGAEIEWTDLSSDDREHWKRAVTVTEALRSQWEAAGERDAWEARHAENAEIVPLVEAGRSARFLYVARRP